MHPILVAAAVVLRDGKLLLTKRQRGDHLEGYWEFPGGKVEVGEAPEAAVVRECREECGIELEVIDIFEVTFHSYPKRDVLLLFYECRLVRGEVQHIEVDDHVWCNPRELGAYQLPPADIPLVEKIQARYAR